MQEPRYGFEGRTPPMDFIRRTRARYFYLIRYGGTPYARS